MFYSEGGAVTLITLLETTSIIQSKCTVLDFNVMSLLFQEAYEWSSMCKDYRFKYESM